MAVDETENVLDVAIIGAGVSGVYSGMRLLDSERADYSPFGKGALKVAIFEQSSRVGGRLLSLEPPGVPTTRVEVGGMRYTSEHKHVLSLVGKFKLTPIAFPVREPQNIAYLRGKRLRMADLVDASKLPYDLVGEEGSSELLSTGFTAVAAERLLRTMTGKEVDLANVDWLEISKTLEFEGMNLADLPFRYLLQRMISHEAFNFSVDTSGYDSIFYTWNGADGFPWNLSDFGGGVSFYRIAEGYQQIPLLCAEAFVESGGEIHMEHSLKRFDCVKLEDGTIGVEFVIVNNGEEKVLRARKLILGMPRRALELIEPTGAVMDSANQPVRDLIGSVTPIPLFKLALCYSYPWWETLPPCETQGPDGNKVMQRIEDGESITDLPVRQLYYWSKDEATNNAVVLVYDDGLALTYWAGLRSHEEKFVGIADVTPDDGLSPWGDFPAPARMVEEVHRQIMQMHGVSDRPDIPAPYAASYQDWGEDPYGGGANFWHVGVKSHEVSKNIVQPVSDLPVFICGESYSHAQGWAEGALATAEDMLQHHLGLMPPIWEEQV